MIVVSASSGASLLLGEVPYWKLPMGEYITAALVVDMVETGAAIVTGVSSAWEVVALLRRLCADCWEYSAMPITGDAVAGDGAGAFNPALM
jgi:ethanolamine utilization protein EutA (predicted chaperonin)